MPSETRISQVSNILANINEQGILTEAVAPSASQGDATTSSSLSSPDMTEAEVNLMVQEALQRARQAMQSRGGRQHGSNEQSPSSSYEEFMATRTTDSDMKGIDDGKAMTAGQRPSVVAEYSDDDIGNNEDGRYDDIQATSSNDKSEDSFRSISRQDSIEFSISESPGFDDNKNDGHTANITDNAQSSEGNGLISSSHDNVDPSLPTTPVSSYSSVTEEDYIEPERLAAEEANRTVKEALFSRPTADVNEGTSKSHLRKPDNIMVQTDNDEEKAMRMAGELKERMFSMEDDGDSFEVENLKL